MEHLPKQLWSTDTLAAARVSPLNANWEISLHSSDPPGVPVGFRHASLVLFFQPHTAIHSPILTWSCRSHADLFFKMSFSPSCSSVLSWAFAPAALLPKRLPQGLPPSPHPLTLLWFSALCGWPLLKACPAAPTLPAYTCVCTRVTPSWRPSSGCRSQIAAV